MTEYLTRQQMFDAVIVGLMKQGKPAMADRGCSYRTPNGLRCGIGMLIPDKEYDEEMEGDIVSHKPEIQRGRFHQSSRPLRKRPKSVPEGAYRMPGSMR
jgi:hypothetical protein